MGFQLINAYTCKEETALFPEVGVFRSVCVLCVNWTQAGIAC